MNAYGLGLGIGGKQDHLYFSHGGGNAGFQCNLIAYNRGDGAVIMTNSANGSRLADEIQRTVAHEYGWPDFQPRVRKQITLAPKALEQFVGTYQVEPGSDVVVTLEGDQLFAQPAGNAKIPLFAETETKFFPKVMDAQLEFLKDDKGAVTHLIVNTEGKEIRAPRK